MSGVEQSLARADLTREEVLEAAAALVAAFAATDTHAYFGSFSPEASFVFYAEPQRLENRASYEQLWNGWVADGWRVTSCESSDAAVQLHGDTAVFVHNVRTTTETHGEAETTYERETIVFRRAENGSVTAVHEHLSPDPTEW